MNIREVNQVPSTQYQGARRKDWAQGEGRRAQGEGRRAKGEGRRAKGEEKYRLIFHSSSSIFSFQKAHILRSTRWRRATIYQKKIWLIPDPRPQILLFVSPLDIGLWSLDSRNKKPSTMAGFHISGRDGEIWTRGLMVPNHARYQAAPHPGETPSQTEAYYRYRTGNVKGGREFKNQK